MAKVRRYSAMPLPVFSSTYVPPPPEPPVSNPAFWLDARRTGYTDAGKTIAALTSASRVLKIADAAANAGDWAASASNVAPFRETDGLYVADNAGLLAPSV